MKNYKQYFVNKFGFQPTVFIDDGHGVDSPGKRTPTFSDGSQIKENDFNRAVAKKLSDLCLASGFVPVLIAPELENISLDQRCIRANNYFKSLAQAHKRAQKQFLAVLVSIHYDAQDGEWGGTKGGITTFHHPESKYGPRLAECIHEELIKGTSQRDRGVRAENFQILRDTNMPAVLTENGFMDVEAEARRMLDPVFQQEVAEEHLRGLLRYFGAV